jgi:phage-related minor tail protein
VKILKWLGIVVVGLAVIIVVVAMQGAGDQRRMQSALQLTGGYVGMTEGQLYELGTSISKNGVGTIGEAREVIFWLVCSGRFSSATIEPSAKAALGLVSAQGLSEKEAVTTLIKMVDPSARAPLDGCPK